MRFALRTSGVACACLVAIVGCTPSQGSQQQDQQSLTLRQITLVDDRGQSRMILDARGENGPSIVLLNSEAKTVLEISCPPAVGPCIVLRDDQGQPRLELGMDSSRGVCHVTVLREGNGGRVELVAERNGPAGVRTIIPGVGTVAMGGAPGLSVGLVVWQSDGSARLNLGAQDAGNSFLTLHGLDGQQRVGLFASETGISGIEILDGKSRPRVQLGIEPVVDQSYLVISSAAGGSAFQVHMEKEGSGSAGLRSSETKDEVLLHCRKGTEPTLSVIANARERLRFSVDATGAPALWVLESDGKVTWKSPK